MVIETYLDRVMVYANRKGVEAVAIRDELRDHLLEKIDRIRSRGVPIEDAVFTAIEDNGRPRIVGYSLRPSFPLIDIRVRGTARGFIAIGPKAIGVFALGWLAIGIFSVGAISMGVVGLGGLVGALLFGWGGVAIVPLGLAMGMVAIGMVAVGVLALGIVAGGSAAIGFWALGVQSLSMYTPVTVSDTLRWIGAWVPSIKEQIYLSVTLLWIFLPSMVLGHLAISREQKRLEKIDPELLGG